MFLLRFHKGDKRSYKLTEEDVVFLASHTNYTKEEIREWFRSTVVAYQLRVILFSTNNVTTHVIHFDDFSLTAVSSRTTQVEQ